MTYLRALQLLTKAYKAARGRLPEGLDLLKVKQKARQKAIDSNKVIDAAEKFDKGNWFRLNKKPAKAGFGKPKKVETEAEMLARMKKQNKEAIQRLKDKKKKPEDKAAGGITGAIKKIKKRFGKKAITTGDKIKRPGNRQLFDDFKKRNKFNTGGLTNISATYDNNPTLQEQFPDKQDYLDLFSSTTTTTPKVQTYAQMAQQSPAGITAVKPIVPIIPPLEGEGGGGPGPKGFDKGYSSANFGLGPNKDVVDYEAEAYGIGRTPLGTASAIITGIPSITKLGFQFAKSVKEKSQQALENFFTARAEAKAKAEALRSLQEAIARNKAQASQQDWSGASSDYSGGFDPSTGNYDDPYDPGETE